MPIRLAAVSLPQLGSPWRTLTYLAFLLLLLSQAGTTFSAVPRTIGFDTPPAFALTQARIVVAPGQEIEKGNVIIRQGVIIAVGPEAAVPPDAEVIDAAGLTIYAGFMDAATSSFIASEAATPAPARTIDFSRHALAATPPDNRKSLTPEFEAAHHLKLDDAELEHRRKVGLTSLHLVPSGRLAGGQGAVITTGGGPQREILLAEPTVAEFQLFGPGGAGYPATLMGGTAHLRQAFLDAARQATQVQQFETGVTTAPVPLHDATWAALTHVATGKQRAVFFTESRDDIHRALDFAEEFKLQPLLWGGRDAYLCLDRLTASKTPVIVTLNYGDEPKIEETPASTTLQAEVKDPARVQRDRLDRWKARVHGAAALHEKGIPFAFSTHGLSQPPDWRKGVRQAIQAGLPRDAALAALTTQPAELVGLKAQIGTIEPGKLAHLVVWTGAFDDERSQLRYLFVEGRKYEYNKDAKPVPPAGTPATDRPALAGEWKLEIESANGPITAKLRLAQDGAKLTGLFDSEQGNGKLKSGEVKPDSVEFVIAIGAGDRDVELKFEGKPVANDPNRLEGTLKSAFGAATKWTATRPPAAAPEKNPVQLTVEEDADAKPETPASTELPTELSSDRLPKKPANGGNLLVKNATVLTGRGQTLAGTSIKIKGGKIEAIGPDLMPDEGMTIIDGTGKFVMPGIIDTHSHIMITQGINEATVSIVPEVRIRDVINTDDVSEYRALAGGVTTARLFHGSANVIGGQDAVIKLKHGATAREHFVPDAPQGVKFALGENVKFQSNRFPNTRMGVEATLNRAFLEALDYRREWQEYDKALAAAPEEAKAKLLPPRRDLRLEALRDIVEHQKFIHSHCYRSDEILMLLRTASNLGIRVWSLQHVLEGYKVAPEIVAHGASCSTFADWWAYKIEAFDAIPQNAALLQEAGANVVIKSDDWELIRHLYHEASKTVRYGGMAPDHALAAITYNPARELGLQDRIGSLEVGKDGDLAIFSGHPLNAFTRCEFTVIEGQIWFARDDQPTAMSAEARTRSATPPAWSPVPDEIRQKVLEIPAPGPGLGYALVNATIHPVDAPDILNGAVVIRGDKITDVIAGPGIPADVQVVDVTGFHIYPGMIDAGTTLGLIEIGKVGETHDYAESGAYQPDLRAGVAVNPDSELIPVARAGGITTILARPVGGTISGQCSLVTLAGWTAPEMVLDYEAGLHINWPGGNDTKEPIENLRQFLKQGRLYHSFRTAATAAGQPGPVADPRFEALKPYLEGQKPVFIEAGTRRQIAEALLFAEQEKLKLVLTGADDAWKLAAELKTRNIPVILGPVMEQPKNDYDPQDAPYANAGRLHEAGVTFCIRSNSASNSRNAPFEAAMAVAHGLPEEEGIKAVTLSAAKILGLDTRLGSITPGKQANLIITEGSPLQPTMQIRYTIINGQPFAPDTRQTRFYEKYRQRLKAGTVGVTAGGS